MDRQPRRHNIYRGRGDYYISLALLLLAFGLRVWELGAQSLWYDEAYCWWVARIVPFSKMLELSARELIPPLPYITLRFWMALAGTTEFALRFPHVLLGILTVAAAGRIAKRLTGQPVAVPITLGFFAVATPVLWAAREVRLYGTLLAYTLLAGMALLEALLCNPARRKRWAWLWGLFTLLSLYTLVLTGFWLLGQALFALCVWLRQDRETRRELIKDMVPPAILALLLYLPWLAISVGALGDNAGYWAGHLPPEAFAKTAIQGITISDFLPAEIAVEAGALLVIGAALSLVLTYRKPWAGLYVLLYATPALLVMSAVFQSIPKWGTRHASLFAPVPFLALAVSWGMVPQLDKRWRRVSAGLGLGLITALSLFFTIQADLNLLNNPDYAHADWRGVAEYVQERRQPGDVVIVETGSVFPAWAYYGGWEGLLPLPQDELLDVSHVQHYTNTVPVINTQLATGQQVWRVSWLDNVTDPTSIVPTLLEEIGEEIETPDFHIVQLRHFKIRQNPEFPPQPETTQRPQAELLPHIELWGSTLPDEQPAGSNLKAQTWWQTDNPNAHRDHFYQTSLRLFDAGGQLWARIDGPPGGGDYRPEHWPANTWVLGTLEGTLSPWMPPGTYSTTLTLYEPGRDSNTISLGTQAITRATTSPELPEGARPVTVAQGTPNLKLLGVGLDQPSIKPCESLNGTLFWEVQQVPRQNYPVTLSLDTHEVTLDPAPGFPTSRWRSGDRFASRFSLPIDCRALETQAKLHITLDAGETTSPTIWDGPVITVKAQRQFEVPPDIIPLGIDAGPGFATLLGYTVTPTQTNLEQPFTVTLIWQAGTTGEIPYTTFAHVTTDGNPVPVAQHDSWPDGGQKPTYTWAEGEIILDSHPLPGLPAGEYRLRFGLYAPDGVRMPLYKDGERLPDDVSDSPPLYPPPAGGDKGEGEETL